MNECVNGGIDKGLGQSREGLPWKISTGRLPIKAGTRGSLVVQCISFGSQLRLTM